MFGFGKKKVKDPQLEALLQAVEVNMANNYKDEAQADFRAVLAYMQKAAPDRESVLQAAYGSRIKALEEKLEGYTARAYLESAYDAEKYLEENHD